MKPILRTALLLSVSLTSVAIAQSTTRPADEQVIRVEGDAQVTITDGTVHVKPATRPANARAATRPAGGVTIRMSGNRFENNGGPDVGKTVAASEVGQATENPLKKLSPEGVALLKKRNIDVNALQSAKAVLINGNFMGAGRREIVNDDPNLLLVFGKGFGTHGSVKSAGPIVAMDDAHFMGNITGESIVWFTGESKPRGEVVGDPIICAPSVRPNQAKWRSDEVWIGTYGWPK